MSSVAEFDFATDFSEGLAAVRMGDHYAYLDRSGKIALSLDAALDGVSPFSEQRAVVRAADLYGYIDQTGKIVVDPQFAGANLYAQGMAVARDVRDAWRESGITTPRDGRPPF